jgi:arsenate reductase
MKPLLTPLAGQTHDLAVTLGCGEWCPYVPGVTYRD